MGEKVYKKTTSKHCVFVKQFASDDFIILLLYIDDMLIIGQNASRIDRLKKQLGISFTLKDLGHLLGIRIICDTKEKKKKLWLSQEKYNETVLQMFQMEKAKAISTPLATHFKLSCKQNPSNEDEKKDMERVPYASVVRSLIYAIVCARPDIAQVVGSVSHFLTNPRKERWNIVKYIMRYLRITVLLA